MLGVGIVDVDVNIDDVHGIMMKSIMLIILLSIQKVIFVHVHGIQKWLFLSILPGITFFATTYFNISQWNVNLVISNHCNITNL